MCVHFVLHPQAPEMIKAVFLVVPAGRAAGNPDYKSIVYSHFCEYLLNSFEFAVKL